MMKALQESQNQAIQAELHRKIGQQLRTQYASLLEDKLPPDLEELLRRLDARLH